MTVQDMDICLNISSGPDDLQPKWKAQGKEKSLKNIKKKSKNKLLAKRGKPSVSKTVPQNVSNEQISGKKRIKQKSLGEIVARKLRTVNSGKNVELSKIKSSMVSRNDRVKLAETLPESKTGGSCDTTASNVINQNLDKSIVSFTKPTKENFVKPLLVRKQNVAGTNEKKSLSDIFSKESSPKDNNSGLLDLKRMFDKVATDPQITKQKLKHSEKIFLKSDLGKLESNNPKQIVNRKIFNRGEDNNGRTRKKNMRENKAGKQDTESTKPHWSKGKASYLFSNNPEIPIIGQRFVKPVNEQVFTGQKFSDLDVHAFMVSNLEQNMQITKMTTVQQKAIPEILAGKDVLVRSQTGSGKTLAYAVPVVESLHKIRPKLLRSDGLMTLVVVPTRELALQTYECFLKLIKPFTWIVPGYLVGGEKRKAEKARLRRGCTILVATPGRLLDHIKHTEALKLDTVKCLILDEADRMLDMGYEKDIAGIVTALNVSSNDSKNSNYDPLQILHDGVHKLDSNKSLKLDVDADESTNATEPEDEESNREPGSILRIQKKNYHSDTDSDSEEDNHSSEETSKTETKTKESCKADENINNPNLSTRQTILLSATLTQAVEKLAGLTTRHPVLVDAAEENLRNVDGNLNEINEDLIVPQSVVQNYIVTPPKLRMVTLSACIAGICQRPGQHKTIIFMATQDMVDYYTDILSSVLGTSLEEYDTDPLVDAEFFKLHGNMTQKERTEVFNTFRKAKSGVLLCTDVAARGLDLPKVDSVIQYTGPTSARDYVHRIGRTARAGSSGSATIFLTPPEVQFVRMLESRRIRIKQRDMDEALNSLVGPTSRCSSAQAAATALQNAFEASVLKNKKLREKACKAYVSWVRFYASYPKDMREVFNRKDLHLGHFAKSFALRDPPQRIGAIGRTLREAEPGKRHDNRFSNVEEKTNERPRKRQDGGGAQRPGLLKRVRMLNTSEYGSGLEPVKKPRKI
ncbi:probable ATP-dependent RNA helicase CG8611 [Orussus abietinus]|uniref:probable ATP-dependent RNA helicase CG8611 n=1 Tax=Orussus abietinus TaxID=222816 RepID=UPI000626E936|nr:probable ATP-dependent RNA helicase CG8611 [Orussus abietinus]XP_012270238.1 probable ATP-dependent RNA helicase CG8611 [Orussus abietinus]